MPASGSASTTASCISASFGFIDTRTKLSDVVVESAAWLSQWGHRVSLHLVGSAPGPVEAELLARASEAGIEQVEITGYVSDETFRDYVLGIDLGVQLRVSPLLGVSGPLSDMAAYGTPAVANRGLCADVDTPAFIDRLPDDVSPVMVAEAIEQRLANPLPGGRDRGYAGRLPRPQVAAELCTRPARAAACPWRRVRVMPDARRHRHRAVRARPLRLGHPAGAAVPRAGVAAGRPPGRLRRADGRRARPAARLRRPPRC